jgi:glycosyltransferase involved in cell wall biosynthesis
VKVLIIADIFGWIIDRITDRMISGIDFDFTKRYYTDMKADELLEESNKHDLVHYNNWCHVDHKDIINQIKVPFLMSVRSHRYPPYALELAKFHPTHVISPMLRDEFPGSYYIPDGIFEQFIPDHEFTVGFAGKPDDYKGFNLIVQACKELGVKFKPATGDVHPENMYDYYKSIDILVSASVAEGFNAPVMECLAMNKAVITTDTGISKYLQVHKIERTVASIKAGIQKFYTSPQVIPEYSWDRVCKQFKELYLKIKG